mgnify:CR=1 FL=1
MPNIYTRTGDDGTTALFGGDRVGKGNDRIEAYGTVDETNSFVGLARAHLRDEPGAERLDAALGQVQDDLFVLGADLATPPDAKPMVPRIQPKHVEALEAQIDAFQDDLPELKTFILPGGTPAAAALHTSRTVCRRAERRTVNANAATPVSEQAMIYLNRLSDFLFVAARWANRQAGVREEPWHPPSDASDAAPAEAAPASS